MGNWVIRWNFSKPNFSPGFREWIETKRRQEFFNALIEGLAVVGLITIIGGIAGALFGSSKK